MTTTVAQLIAKLQTLPQDTEVECGKEHQSSYYTEMIYAPVDLEYFSIHDYSSPEDRAKYPKMNGRVIVYIEAE